MYKRMEYK